MQGASSPITDWINSDVKTANTVSIIMIIFAAWAGIEAISNVAGIEIPPETGMATNIDPDDTQRTNNGIIVGLGAVLGTLGIVIQSMIPRGEEQQEEERGPVFDEDLVKLTKWLCSRGTTTAQFFDWADVDSSGSIDMVEFANALRASEIANLPPWEIEDLVKLMDINSDGRIDLPELDIALLNIRNALGIEFVPYVEEEKQEEETVDNSEEEAEEEIAEEAEATDESETDEQVTEESEEEIAEEVEATDESDTDEEVTEESEEEIAEEVEATDESDTDEEVIEDNAESMDDSATIEDENLEDGPTEETEASEEEEQSRQEAEVEESNVESESVEEEFEEPEVDESAEDNAVEEPEDSEDSPDIDEATEEVVEEIPKKKKKF